MKKKRLWSDIVIYSLLTIAALYTLFPLLMALMNSFKSNRELLTNVMSWPTEWNLDNYIRTYEKMHYGRSFVNTAILAGLSVSLIILFSALAGWKLCRTKTGLSRFLLNLRESGSSLPPRRGLVQKSRAGIIFRMYMEIPFAGGW